MAELFYRLAITKYPVAPSTPREAAEPTTPATNTFDPEGLRSRLASSAQTDGRTTGQPLPQGPGFPRYGMVR